MISETLDQPPDTGEVISSPQLADRVADILMAAGMVKEDATRVAAMLVFSQESAIDSHGIAHLPSYVQGLASGSLKAQPKISVVSTNHAVAIIDADCAPGVLAGLRACDEAIARARSCGAGIVAVKNSSHFGAASAFTEYLVSNGMIALVFTNASPTVAPRGGKVPLFGTNPIAAGFPRANGSPVLIDFATTAGSRGKIRKAAAEGAAIPVDWALDKDGLPTTDAKSALGGTMQALGGEKGTILPLLVELLCVGLSGGKPGVEILVPQEPSSRPRGISHLFIALDASAFGGSDVVGNSIAAVSSLVEQSEPTIGESPMRMPGNRGSRMREKARREGIRLSPAVAAALAEAQIIAEKIKKSLSHKLELPK